VWLSQFFKIRPPISAMGAQTWKITQLPPPFSRNLVEGFGWDLFKSVDRQIP